MAIIFQMVLSYKNDCILIQIWQKLVLKGPGFDWQHGGTGSDNNLALIKQSEPIVA